MTYRNRQDAQRRNDQIQAFRKELSLLEQTQILHLTVEQKQQLDAHHAAEISRLAQLFDIDRSLEQKHLTLGMKVASFLGALALAASVFFLFYQFWGYLSLATQIVILVAAPILTLTATVFIANRDASGYFVKLSALVCFACFVLNVFMYGQIFNITPSDKAFMAWAAFALLLAYALDTRLLLAAGIICLAGFLSSRVGTWSGIYWIHFGERPENFLPVALLLMMAPVWINHDRFIGFAAIYRVSALILWFMPLLILSNWGDISYLNTDPDTVEVIYQLMGFVCASAVIWWGIQRDWMDTMNTGTVFFVIFLYTRFFDWWWDYMPKYLFFFVLGLTALLILMIFQRLRGEISHRRGTL